MSRVDVSVKISHNVDVLQSAEEGDFKSSGTSADQSLRKFLFETNVSVRLPAHEYDSGVTFSLTGAGEISEQGVELGEWLRGDALRGCHFFR